jgi:hypothetical protein
MREYFVTVFAVGFAAAVFSLVNYDKKGDTVARLSVSVILLAITVTPVFGMIENLFSTDTPMLSPWEGELSYEYEEVAEDALREGIVCLLAEEFSLDGECFSVKLRGFDFSTMRADEIFVTLHGRAALCDPLRVERFINSYEIGECYAEIGI